MKAFSGFVSLFDRAASARIAYKATADAAGKLAMFAVIVAAARTLPRDAFGILALALTSGWLLGVASDAGLPMYLARAAARDPARSRTALASVLRLRAGSAAIAVAAGTLLGWLWIPQGVRLAFTLVVAAQVAGAMLETAGHALRGLGRSEVEAHVHLGQRAAMAAAALLVLGAAPSLSALAWALALPPLLALPIMIAVALRVTRTPARSPGDRTIGPALAEVARSAAPLGLGVLLSALYFRIDVYFVEHWRGLDAVAAYNAVYRIVDAVRLVPAAVLAVTFPTLVRATDRATVARLVMYLGAAGAAIALIAGLAAPAIVTGVYGAGYADAAPVLQVLALSVPLFFLNYALTHQVIGWDGQRAYLGVAAAALVANLAANAALVPRYGTTGAAMATGITELVVTAGCLRALAESRRARLATAVTGGLP